MKTLSALLLLISLTAQANTDIETEDEIFAFMGELIEMTETPQAPEIEDGRAPLPTEYVSTFRVIETLEGAFASDELTLYAYDHFGKPEFSDYRYVMLFMREEEGKYVYMKYSFSPVLKTSSDGWASCGLPYFSTDGEDAVPLEEIDFDPQLEFSMVLYNEESAKEDYPEPIFEHLNNKAICRQGLNLDELYRRFKEKMIKNGDIK